MYVQIRKSVFLKRTEIVISKIEKKNFLHNGGKKLFLKCVIPPSVLLPCSTIAI